MYKFLRFLLWMLFGVLLLNALPPYIAFAQFIGAQVGGDVCQSFYAVPFLGGILGTGCRAIGGWMLFIAGAALWLFVNLAELLPWMNLFSIPFLSRHIDRLRKAPQLQVDQGDREALAKAKNRFNTVVERSLQGLIILSLAVYVFDLWWLGSTYQALDEVGSINWAGLIITLVQTFGLELILVGIGMLNNSINPSMATHKNPQYQEPRVY